MLYYLNWIYTYYVDIKSNALVLLSSLILIVTVVSRKNDLVPVSGCICPGREVLYQCTVCGPGATEFSGSLFNCAGDKITLRHQAHSPTGECNGGAVTASIIDVFNTSNNDCYLSQLNISMSAGMNNKTITCLHVDGSNETVIGTVIVSFTRGNVILLWMYTSC